MLILKQLNILVVLLLKISQKREIVEHVGKDGVITESDVEKMSYLNALYALLLHPLSLTLFFFKKKGWLRPLGVAMGWFGHPCYLLSFFLSFFFFKKLIF
jgi:hypothetical protein